MGNERVKNEIENEIYLYKKNMCIDCKFLVNDKCIKNRKPYNCVKNNLKNKE